MFFKNEESKAIAAYVAVCILWGSTYLAIRIGVSAFPPELFAGMRNLIAGTILLFYARLRGLEFPSNLTDIRNQSIVGLFHLFGGNGLVVWVEQWAHSGITSLLVSTSPLFIAIIELLIPGRPRMEFKGWLGLLIGFSGVAILVLSDSGAGNINIKGAVLLLIAAFLWAMGSVYSKTFKTTGSMIANISIQMLAGGTALLILGISLGELSRISISAKGIGALLYLIVFGSLLGYSSYIYILKKWPAAKAGTYAYINPPVAVLLGFLILGEPLNITILFSTIVILAGVLLVQLSKINSNSEAAKGEDSSM
ncbi:MAG: EamA family transporter [Gracilibacteraceae bacterium]|jgi:drug/metabolite transporter (DMT)-like permease|nr:EamA family transporter [Gracilibacteraceae bacterium]